MERPARRPQGLTPLKPDDDKKQEADGEWLKCVKAMAGKLEP